jgi:hypothetical protein
MALIQLTRQEQRKPDRINRIYRIDLFWFPSFHFTKLKNQNREHPATHVGASDPVYDLGRVQFTA